MGTHLLVLRKRFPMNTNMAGLNGFHASASVNSTSCYMFLLHVYVAMQPLIIGKHFWRGNTVITKKRFHLLKQEFRYECFTQFLLVFIHTCNSNYLNFISSLKYFRYEKVFNIIYLFFIIYIQLQTWSITGITKAKFNLNVVDGISVKNICIFYE